MNMRRIARLLDGEVAGRDRILCPGPGHSRLDRSLSVRFNGDELIVHSFAGDDWKTAKDHVARLLGLPEWRPSLDFEEQRRRQEAKRELRAKAEAEAEAKNTRVARLIWDQGVDPRGTAAELYLKSRGLTLTDESCTALRYHPSAAWHVDPDHPDYPPGWHPTLLAAFRSIATDELTAIHRIRVDRPSLWPKTRRKMLGPVSGAAVKLAAVTDGVLAVGEGVETCMAANQMGFGPAWAVGSSSAIKALPVLDGIRKLILLGENDDASRKATERCAQRWLRAGRDVTYVDPDVGKDLNDELLGRR